MRVPYETMKETFRSILLRHGFGNEEAEIAASIFADNSLDGVYTHGLNRFPKIIEDTDKGFINPSARVEAVFSAGAFERWDGHRGFGPLNAAKAMERAIEISKKDGSATRLNTTSSKSAAIGIMIWLCRICARAPPLLFVSATIPHLLRWCS